MPTRLLIELKDMLVSTELLLQQIQFRMMQKKYFAEENEDSATKIKWLEGSNGIEEGIPKIVEEMSLSQINQTIQPFSDRIGFNLWPIIESKIKQNITN